jgi:choloylglycine hydrolase
MFGKNYDWMIGDGAIFVNKRGVTKWSSVEGEKNPALWTSRYGSVTFNQYGREQPSGGMNEAGLVIEVMWLEDTEYPAADDRAVVDVLEWIQYNLDTAATTADVIRNSDKMRIASRVKLHYLINDRAGEAATIEFLKGRLVAHSGSTLVHAALTNDTYESSTRFAAGRSPDGVPGEGSLERFSRAAAMAAKFGRESRDEGASVKFAFELLTGVAQKDSTQWSIVYDQKRGRIHFRTRNSADVKTIDTSLFDYSCGAAVKMLDLNVGGGGRVNDRFADYSRAANRALIERAYTGTPFLANVPAAARDDAAAFPESFTRTEQAPAKNDRTRLALDSGRGRPYLQSAVLRLFVAYRSIIFP